MGIPAVQDISAAAALDARLSGIEKRLDAALERLARITVLERRLEESIPFLATRSDRLVGSQSIYLGDHTAVTFLRNGLRILVDTRSLDVGIHLLTLGEWEQTDMAVFASLLQPGNRVLDIGANHGVYALHAALAVGTRGQVHAFEPNPRLAWLADFSLKLNGFGDYATMHQMGVSDAPGDGRLFFSDALSGSGAILQAGVSPQDHEVNCRLEALDNIFPDPGFTVDVIKMDIEGFEGLALRGMRRLLARSPQVKIMMEYAPEWIARAGYAPEVIFEVLEALGLKIWIIGDAGRLKATAPQGLLASAKPIQNILLARELPRAFL
jgi:FkbM family methyltransferase